MRQIIGGMLLGAVVGSLSHSPWPIVIVQSGVTVLSVCLLAWRVDRWWELTLGG